MSTEYNAEEIKAIKEFLYKVADDQLIIGHRNSEWTGLGPILEEDIAFSSIAQDKIGQSAAIFGVLHELGEADPDTVAFTRNGHNFHSCQFVEYPIGEYDFSLMRHFLFDHAEWHRFNMLAESTFEPVAKLARKFRGEIKYHIMHADVWVTRLGSATEESHNRMQNTLNESFNLALGIFEPGDNEVLLAEKGIFIGEKALQERWLESVSAIIDKAGLKLPEKSTWAPVYGGRKGQHSEYLQPLLDEMTEVFQIDPSAEW